MNRQQRIARRELRAQEDNHKYIFDRYSSHGGRYNVGDRVRVNATGKEDVIIDKRNMGWNTDVVMYLLKTIKGEKRPNPMSYYFPERELTKI